MAKKKSGALELYGDIDCYKFTIPEIPEGEEQIYTLSFAGSNNCTATLLNENEIITDYISGYSYENFSENREITFTEGGIYYLTISDANYEVTKTSYSFKLTKGQSSETLYVAPDTKKEDTENEKNTDTAKSNADSLKNIKTLMVRAKKKTNKMYIVSLKNAKYTITINRKIIKNEKQKVKKLTKTVSSGSLTVKLSKKLKKGDVIKVTVSKSGYKTKKTTVKIK